MKFINKITKGIRFRTLGLAISSFVFLFLGASAWRLIKGSAPPEDYLFFLLSGSALLMTISSFFVIRYKEMPRLGGLSSVTGFWAIFWGSIGLIIFALGFIVSLYEAITEIF